MRRRLHPPVSVGADRTVVDDASYRASRMVRNMVGQVPIIDDRVRVYRIQQLFTKCGEGKGKPRSRRVMRAKDETPGRRTFEPRYSGNHLLRDERISGKKIGNVRERKREGEREEKNEVKVKKDERYLIYTWRFDSELREIGI